MRIVHLVIGGEVAGGQVVALRLARAARDARPRGLVRLADAAGRSSTGSRPRGCAAHVLPIAGALDVGGRAAAARRCCDASGPTSCTRTATSRATSSGAWPGGSPARAVIAHMHIENAFRAGGAGREAQVALDNATARLCASIVAVSDATREALLAQGYPAARTVTIHNGIEPAEPVEPAALDLPPGRRGSSRSRGSAT